MTHLYEAHVVGLGFRVSDFGFRLTHLHDAHDDQIFRVAQGAAARQVGAAGAAVLRLLPARGGLGFRI